MLIRLALLFTLSFQLLLGESKSEKIYYPLQKEPIDVVIPCTKKDLILLNQCINGIKKNCKQIRRVIVISPEKLTDHADWYDESQFPFSKNDVGLYLNQCDIEKAECYCHQNNSRVGWYFQQLLKLYAPFVIPGISSNVLVLDADTVFFKKTAFMNSLNAGLYNYSDEYHHSYFEHASKLTEGYVTRVDPDKSGICHHMLFQRPVLEDLFQLVESIHHMEFWKAFCLCVSEKDLYVSGASEYEIYFNFVLSRTAQVEIRELQWDNIVYLSKIHNYKKKGYHYISCHSYHRKSFYSQDSL